MRFVPILFGVAFLLPECGVVATDDRRREQDAPEIPLDDPVAVGEAYCRRAARCGGSALLVYQGGTLERLARLERPDVILSDVLMPDMDGFELSLTSLRTT